MSFLNIKIDPNRIYGLDILRAVAIIFVLFDHSGAYIGKSYQMRYRLWIFDGVSIFFVLSGFLIGGILIKILESNKPKFRILIDFWIKRWFRTIPPYFLVLVISILLSRQFHFSYLGYFIFIQNLVQKQHGFFGESWSLSVEEWFYLLIPSAIFGLCVYSMKPKKAIIWVAVVILFLITVYRLIKYLYFQVYDFDAFDNSFRKIVATRLDSIMYGLIGAYLAYYYQEFWLKNKRGKLIVGIFILFGHQFFYNTGYRPFNIYDVVFSFSVSSFGTLLLLPFLSELKFGHGLFYEILTKISLISYSAYLLNLYIIMLHVVNPLLDYLKVKNTLDGNLLGVFLFWSLTISLSIISYKYFEVPTTALRNRFKSFTIVKSNSGRKKLIS